MMRIIYSWFSLIVLLPAVLAITCYDCGPDTHGKDCLKPTPNMVKSCGRGEVCLSYFFLSQKISNVGAYRLCHSPGSGNACPDLFLWARKAYNGIRYNCSTCNTNNCNNVKFSNVGQIIPDYPKLSCYECNPENDGDKCLNPTTSTNQVQCEPKDFNKPLCYSYYITSNKGSLAGAYRGCAESENGKRDPCDDFVVSSHKNKHQILNCTTCSNGICNSQKLGYPKLSCYKCNPEDDGDLCLNPNNATVQVECESKHFSPLCYSYYIKSNNGNITGAYRGCVQSDNGKQDSCDDFVVSSYKNKHQLINCTTCSKGTCNNQEFVHINLATCLHHNTLGSIILTLISYILLHH